MFLELWQRQIESSLDKDSHLRAGDGFVGAVIPAAAPAGDAFSGELFDPGGEAGDAHIGEITAGGWRGVSGAMFGSEQEDGHLRAGDGFVGAVISAAAPAGDAFG